MLKARRFERSQVWGARTAYSNSIFSMLLSQIPKAVITIILFHGLLRNMYLFNLICVSVGALVPKALYCSVHCFQ